MIPVLYAIGQRVNGYIPALRSPAGGTVDPTKTVRHWGASLLDMCWRGGYSYIAAPRDVGQGRKRLLARLGSRRVGHDSPLW